MIRLTLRKVFGQQAYSFSFEGQSFFDVVLASQELGFRDVLACGLCKGKSLYLRAYRTEKEKYEYVKVVCSNRDCRASATFGKRKDDGAFFLRKDDQGKVLWERPPAKPAGNGQVNPPSQELTEDLGDPHF